MRGADMTRRGLLATLTAAPLASSTREKSRRRYGGYPVGVHGASLAEFPAPEAARMCAGLGLHWMEITAAQIRIQALETRYPGPAASIEEIRALRRTLESLDISASAFGPIRLAGDEKENRGIFDRAKELGVRNLSCIPQLEALDGLEKLADEFDIRLAIHNNAPGAPYSAIADVVSACEGRGPNVGACLDIGNALRANEDPAEALRKLGSRLLGIHLKDVDARHPDSEVIVIGKGFLDVDEFFATLAEVGFPDDGALSLEYLESPEDPLPGIREGLKIARKAIVR